MTNQVLDIVFFLLGVAVWAAWAAVVAVLVAAFVADPSFWPAFWLVLVLVGGVASAVVYRVRSWYRSGR